MFRVSKKKIFRHCVFNEVWINFKSLDKPMMNIAIE